MIGQLPVKLEEMEMATEIKEKVAGWTKSGSIYTLIVKDTGKVAFDRSKASKQLLDFCLDYGIGRIFPDRTSSLKGLDKLEGMRKLIALAESGAASLTIRETAEEKLAREQRELESDTILALERLGYKPEIGIANLMAKHKWGRPMAIVTLAGQKAVAAEIAKIIQERKMERAPKPEELDMDDMFSALSE